jgi:hypothetical protein
MFTNQQAMSKTEEMALAKSAEPRNTRPSNLTRSSLNANEMLVAPL